MIGKVLLPIGLLICCGATVTALDSGARGNEGADTYAATHAAADTARVKLAIDGMTCGSCATTARIVLERVEGVYDAEVSYDSASAVVLYDPEKTSPDEFIAYLAEMTDYRARVAEPADEPMGKP